jgi:hypothetical protein
MPHRIPTPGISTPAVRKSPTAQPSVKPAQSSGKTVTSKSGTTTTYNNKGQATFIKGKDGSSAGTAKTKGFQFGGGTQ